MSWDDIDLDIIKKGMITRSTQPGDEESEHASMTDILNIFSQAANERLNMMRFEPEDSEIEFFKGEIRNKDFWDKYRDLISQYDQIMSGITGGRQGGEFYRESVMTDPVNHEDYVYTADDFEAELGEDVYAIIRVGGSSDIYTISQIFIADLLQGFYKIYEMTGIFASGANISTGTATINKLTAIEGEVDHLRAGPVKGEADGTYEEVKALLNWQPQGDTSSALYAEFFQSTRFNFTEVDVWEIQGRNPTFGPPTQGPKPDLISRNNQQFIYKAEDLEGELLEMEFTGLGILQYNFTNGDNFPPENETPFESSLMFEGSGTNTIVVEWSIVSEAQEAEGSAVVLGIKGGASPIPETPVTDPMNGDGNQQTDWFRATASQLVFVRINNEALDFHIADE